MNNHDSEDDFLNKLYQQSAIDKPPVELDKQILELAKANRQRNRFAMTMNLQRVLSVAAVMVLSVCIFFEIDKDHPAGIDQELFYPPQNMLRSSPSSASRQQTKPLEMNEEAQVIKSLKMKQAKELSEKESANFMADDVSELSAQEPSTSDSSARSAMPIMQKSLKRELAQEIPEAEDMLKAIKQLLASGKEQEAKLVYGEFKILFPKYPVPRFMRDAMNNEK